MYLAAEWTGVLPLPAGQKWPPPTGFTGQDGSDPDPEEIEEWRREEADGNTALRLPEDVVGVDVDAYEPKEGRATLEALQAAWGALPATWISTSRREGGDRISGIRLFRIPVGVKLTGQAGAGIEILQHHHRYVVVWPSINPTTMGPYRWYGPDGQLSDRAPRPDELPELPVAWLEGLQERSTGNGTATAGASLAPKAEWSKAVQEALGDALTDMATGMSRHDTATETAMLLARLEERGHPGAGEALGALGEVFTDAISGDRSTGRQAAKEWTDIVSSARKKVAATPATTARYGGGDRRRQERVQDWVQRTRRSDRDGRPQDEAGEEGEAAEAPGWASLLMSGKAWLLSGSEKIEALWGDGERILAARQQPTVIAGESGSGKTTLAQHLILGSIGVPGYEELLALPVAPTEGKVLLLASDRPDQARLSMWRLLHSSEAWDLLDERLVVWQGPPPSDVGNDPFLLLDMARHTGATLVVPDSLKDMAVRLVDDAVGAAVNQAFQLLVADGRDVCVPHHLRKGGRQDKSSEITINDLYGSAHIFNGAGSVLFMEHHPTDYEMRQLKSPNGEYATLRFGLDKNGSASLGGADPVLTTVRMTGDAGASTAIVARTIYHPDGTAPATDPEIEKTRRRLQKLAQEGLIVPEGQGRNSRWVAV